MFNISMPMGNGNIKHNKRILVAKNVDKERIENNIVVKDEPLGEAYAKLFEPSKQRYNSAQKRSDRQIKTTYFEYLFDRRNPEEALLKPLLSNGKKGKKDHPEKSHYEHIVQIGNAIDMGYKGMYAERAAAAIKEYLDSWNIRNPNFYMFFSIIHRDEATVHAHSDYIPVGHNYKNGMDTRNSMSRALEEMGFTGKNAINDWKKREERELIRIAHKYGLECRMPDENGNTEHKEPEEYREIMRERDRLDLEVDKLNGVLLASEEIEKIPYKKSTVHKGKVIIDEKDFYDLKRTASEAVGVEMLLNTAKELRSDNAKEKAYNQNVAEDNERRAEETQQEAERNLAERAALSQERSKLEIERNQFAETVRKRVNDELRKKATALLQNRQRSDILNGKIKAINEQSAFPDLHDTRTKSKGSMEDNNHEHEKRR